MSSHSITDDRNVTEQGNFSTSVFSAYGKSYRRKSEVTLRHSYLQQPSDSRHPKSRTSFTINSSSTVWIHTFAMMRCRLQLCVLGVMMLYSGLWVHCKTPLSGAYLDGDVNCAILSSIHTRVINLHKRVKPQPFICSGWVCTRLYVFNFWIISSCFSSIRRSACVLEMSELLSLLSKNVYSGLIM